MSNEKFTQGEWRTNQRPHGKVSIVGDSGQQVCLMWNSKERDANCDLISAAPYMYRALRELLSRIENDKDVRHWFIDEQAMAIKALAKADGEQL